MYTGCSVTAAQTFQNENFHSEHLKNVQRTMTLKCILFKKNAKGKRCNVTFGALKISFIELHKIIKRMRNKI